MAVLNNYIMQHIWRGPLTKGKEEGKDATYHINSYPSVATSHTSSILLLLSLSSEAQQVFWVCAESSFLFVMTTTTLPFLPFFTSTSSSLPSETQPSTVATSFTNFEFSILTFCPLIFHNSSLDFHSLTPSLATSLPWNLLSLFFPSDLCSGLQHIFVLSLPSVFFVATSLFFQYPMTDILMSGILNAKLLSPCIFDCCLSFLWRGLFCLFPVIACGFIAVCASILSALIGLIKIKLSVHDNMAPDVLGRKPPNSRHK